MKKCFLFTVVAVAAVFAGAATRELEWCTIETPDVWNPGKPIVVKVTPKNGIPGGMKVGSHLHWMKKDGWGGVLSFQNPKDAVPGTTLTFVHVPKKPDALDRIDALTFLAPGGDFAKKVRDGHAEIKLGAPSAPPYPARPETVTYKKSALWVERNPEPAGKNEEIKLTVGYKLDPSDTWGTNTTKITAIPLGPWIDNPDGKINKNRTHIGYYGLWQQRLPVEPGEGTVTFTWKVGQTYRYNEMFFLLKFTSPDGKDWPWDCRGGNAVIIPENKTFKLVSNAPGGLFTYGEKPSVALEWGKTQIPGPKEAVVTVRDISGKTVMEKKTEVDPARKSERIELDGIDVRGTFSVTVSVDGIGDEYTFFGTIPEFRRRAGVRTPFVATNIGSESMSKLAAALGFSYVRHFTGWAGLEPMRGMWRLDNLDKTIKANRDAGLLPWLCLQGPPAWALPEKMYSAGFEPSPFDLEAWREAVDKIARRYKNDLWGFEWLNEIVPGGKCDDPVAGYVGICREGTKAAKAVNPEFVIQLAGGLWPHNYRTDLLNAGVGKYIDVLPVHYQNYAGIVEAKRDLDVRGIKGVSVADNESASGLSTWGMNAADTLSLSVPQCLHVMAHWPDELAAGADFVAYFGGSPNAAGNWTYLLDARTPRPVAVTLAVVHGKLAYAKPVGKFFIDGASVQLFEDNGRAIAFVRAAGENGRKVKLPASGPLTITDYQGNTSVSADGTVTAADMPVIVDGADLNALKLHSVCMIGTSRVPVSVPQHVVKADKEIGVPMRLFNPYPQTAVFTVKPVSPEWGVCEEVKMQLKPGESANAEMRIKAAGKISASTALAVTVTADKIGHKVPLKYILYAIDPEYIGNLLKNGDMETPSSGGVPGWTGQGVLAEDPEDPENHVLKLTGGGSWKHSSQGIDIPVPGQTYLYTAWVWSSNMDAGSNMSEKTTDGKNKDYYMPQVFSTGTKGTSYWRFLAKKFASTDKTKSLGFTPVGKGPDGVFVLYDNISVTLYKGSDFAASAGKAASPVAADGDLSDWREIKSSVVPLLCDNQIKTEGGYKWTPSNLSGTARLAWDDDCLLFSARVRDDVMQTKPVSVKGEDTLKGDSIALCIFPAGGADEFADNQIRWYISKASPGGGSGACTVYRPAAYSCGGKSGQLAKDSSTYSVAVVRKGSETVYELRIPWAEIPGFTPAEGASFGCNAVLFDSDSAEGAGTGRMTWGGGLKDSASDCGIVTLVR